MNKKKTVLNAGAGPASAGSLPDCFRALEWEETRLDIDPRAKPDVVGSFADMNSLFEDGWFDALYSSHAVEHLYAHQLIPAFREFRRVLRADGFALVTCPDLTSICQFLLKNGAEEIAYQSPAGPIRPIDMLFGHGASIAGGFTHMAHNTGFTAERLARVSLAAGFAEARVMVGDHFDLWGILMGPEASQQRLAALFQNTFLSELFASTAVQMDASSSTTNLF